MKKKQLKALAKENQTANVIIQKIIKEMKATRTSLNDDLMSPQDAMDKIADVSVDYYNQWNDNLEHRGYRRDIFDNLINDSDIGLSANAKMLPESVRDKWVLLSAAPNLILVNKGNVLGLIANILIAFEK